MTSPGFAVISNVNGEIAIALPESVCAAAGNAPKSNALIPIANGKRKICFIS